jgi:hypothetical protein
MKMCAVHWEALRTAIEEKGLFHLVSGSGAGLKEKILNEDLAGPTPENFDPLMAANMSIWSNAIEQGGLYLMTDDYCPICESEKHKGPSADWWITNAVNEQFEKAKQMGLLRPVS